jgi:F-type H+-transporting ATPase subunit a
MALGFGGYLGKFLVFDGIRSAFGPDAHGNKRSTGGMLGQLALGLIDLFVGLLEGLSEFIKVIAFTFRLFGNIFAGEVMLIVLTFLVPLVLTIPFLGFEVFVGLIQAFIFFILSVAFYSVAVTSHSHEEGH